jgi:ribonuclease P protein subunit POP4
LLVIRSSCPSVIGISGILVQETTSTFRLVTHSNQLKTILKHQHIFTLSHHLCLFELYGSHFCSRIAERSSKKFKQKATIQL